MFDPIGFHLVKTLDKRAFEPGYPENPISTEEYNDWRALGHTVGVMMGSKGNLYVVDVDDAEAAADTLMRWELPPTLLVKTPSGGFHYYFTYDGPSLPRKIRPFPGLDLLGKGGYANCHLDRKGWYKHYQVAHIAPMPESLLKAWHQCAEPATPSSIENMPTMQPGSRNNAVASLAGSLLKGGTQPQDAHDQIQAINAATAHPLPAGEVAHTVASIARYHAPPPIPPPIPLIADFGHTPEELMALELPPIEPLIGPLMGGTITTLHGESGAGKSLFALHMGLHLAAGLNFESWRCKEPKRVLYLDQENPASYVQSRMMPIDTGGRFRIAHRAWLKERGIHMNLGHPAHQEELLKHAPDLLILDSLLALNPPDENINMNSAEWFERLMPLFDAITDQGGGVLLLGNLNKQGRAYGTEAQVWRSDRNWTAEKWEQMDNRFSTGLHLDGQKERGLTETPIKSKWRFSLLGGWKNEI